MDWPFLVFCLCAAVFTTSPDAFAAEGLGFTADSPVFEAAASPNLDLRAEVTLEAWIRADPMPSSGGRILDKMPPGSQDGYLLDTWPGNSLRFITANGQLRFDGRIPADRWAHVAGAYSAPRKIMQLYVNGKLAASTSEGAFPELTGSPTPLCVGADSNGANRFLGRIRRCALYRRALSAEEIAERFADPATKLDGVLGDWILPEAPGPDIHPLSGNVVLHRPLTLSGLAPAPAEPLSLWYRQPAARWTEALVLGNGRLGGMLWGGVDHEEIDLNEDTLWSGEPGSWKNPEAMSNLPRVRELILEGKNREASDLVRQRMHGHYNECFMPMGKLLLDFPAGSGVSDYRRDLDLTRAVAHVRYRSGDTTFTRETFLSAPDQALVMRLTGDKPGALSFSVRLSSELRPRVTSDHGRLILTGRCPVHADPSYVGAHRVEFDDSANPRGMRFQICLAARSAGGAVKIEEDRLIIRNAPSVTLLLTAATSYNGPFRSPSQEGKDFAGLAAADMEKVLVKPDDRLLADHVADYRRLFNRVSLTLCNTPSPTRADARTLPTDRRIVSYQPGADPGLVALFYQFGRYLLISCSRPGSQPVNLQGMWSIDLNPDWSANWTLNCNAEINYWPAETANLSECHLPLLDLVEELKVDGFDAAREIYGAHGWVAHHNTDIWRGAGPVDGDPVWFIFQTGGAWLCQHIWEHYQFTGDVDFLRQRYPTLREAAVYFLDTMIREPGHNWLVDAPATNFENSFRKPGGESASVCMGPTADVQMIRELLQNCVRASNLLGVDSSFRSQCEKAIPLLAPMQVSTRNGHLQEWIDDWDHADPGNCQMLSLWGVICGTQITPRGTPELAAAVLKTMQDRGIDRGCGSWQSAFPANAYARLHQSDQAQASIDRLLEQSVNPNMTAHFGGSAWQIDGNLGVTAAIAETLLQSHAGEIEILPTLPPAWSEGTVTGLCARGGFEVDIAWKAGKLLHVTIRTKRGGTCHLRYGEKTVVCTLSPGGQRKFGSALD